MLYLIWSAGVCYCSSFYQQSARYHGTMMTRCYFSQRKMDVRPERGVKANLTIAAWKRLLGRIWEDLKRDASNWIFKTFILPILDYCDSVWSRCKQKRHRCIWTIAESGRYRTMVNSTFSDSPFAYRKYRVVYSRCHKPISNNSSNTSKCSSSDF